MSKPGYVVYTCIHSCSVVIVIVNVMSVFVFYRGTLSLETSLQVAMDRRAFAGTRNLTQSRADI